MRTNTTQNQMVELIKAAALAIAPPQTDDPSMGDLQMFAKSEELRRRPESLRYFYMAISTTNVHVGSSYGGLKYVIDKHGVEQLFVADIVSSVAREVSESAEDFLAKWKANYDNAEWDYFAEYDAAVAAAKRRR